MKFSSWTTLITTVTASLLTALVYAEDSDSSSTCKNLTPLKIYGKHFFNEETKEYFPINGIAYYPRPNDGLYDDVAIDFFTEDFRNVWERDIEEVKALGVNFVRIYAVAPGEDHDGFFCALKNAGIYVLLELSATCEGCAITDDKPPACYPDTLKTRGEYIIYLFSKYDNIIGFSAGNEVGLLETSQGKPEVSGPCQKKFIRDMRAYVQSCAAGGMRQIPIGVIVADSDLESHALYYSCRSDPSDELENAEWFGLNQYRNCDGTAKSASDLIGYQDLLANFTDWQLPIPVVFTEFGCKDASFPTIDGYQGQRTFIDVDAFFSDEYLAECTGGVVFEYSTELANSEAPWPFKNVSAGNFGTVYFSPEDCDDIGIPWKVVRFPEFEFLADKYKGVGKVTPPPYDGRPTVTECPSEYKPLSFYNWTADEVDSYQCPMNVVVDCGCGTSSSTDGSSTTTTTTTTSGGSTSSSSGGSSSTTSGGGTTTSTDGSSSTNGDSKSAAGLVTFSSMLTMVSVLLGAWW
jgi:1,3-beta-glucanosyltransferase GAS5